MPEFIYVEKFKRKGIAWKKSGLYVHPPEQNQWDNFLPNDSNPIKNNMNESTLEAEPANETLKTTTTTKATTKTTTLVTKSAAKVPSVARKSIGTTMPQVPKSRRRRRQSRNSSTAVKQINHEESLSPSFRILSSPPLLPRGDTQEEVFLMKMQNVKQKDNPGQASSRQSLFATKDHDPISRAAFSPPIDHGMCSSPKRSLRFRKMRENGSMHSMPPSPPGEKSNEETESKKDSSTPFASNDLNDDISPVGVDQFVHQSNKEIISSQEQVVASYCHVASIHQPVSEVTTSPLKERQLIPDVVVEDHISHEQGVETPSESPMNDVYDVLRRLERKAKRQRTIPQPAHDLQFGCGNDFDGTTIPKGVDPVSNQFEALTTTEAHMSDRTQQPISNPHPHVDSSPGSTGVGKLSRDCVQEVFQEALHNRGFLDQYVFFEEETHSSNSIPVRNENTIVAPLGTPYGDDCYWRMVTTTLLELSLSETLEMNQLRWEASLLEFLESCQDERRFPHPVDICLYRNKVALTLELGTGSSVLGTVLQVLQLHGTNEMGPIPETVVSWLSLEMIKILALLHKIGIAHNNLGLESFLVVTDGTEWTLLLIGLGTKSTVQVGEDLKSHFHHDMLSIAFLTWSLLMGCAPFQFSNVDGKVQVEGMQYITMNMYLRGRLGWTDLFAALVNSAAGSQGIASILESTLDTIRRIPQMTGANTTEIASGDAIAGFFNALLVSRARLLSEYTIGVPQFAKTLGMSSEDLVFKLHFGQSLSSPLTDIRRSLTKVSSEGQSDDVKVSQCLQAKDTSHAKHPKSNTTMASNGCEKTRSKSNANRASSFVESVATPTRSATLKPDGATSIQPPLHASTVFEAGNHNGLLRSGCKDRVVVTFVRAKHRTMKDPVDKTKCRRSTRTVLMCGMKGCKNQFPVNNGYMWVMMVGLEEQDGRNGLKSVIPTHDPMHLVCLQCREPNGDPMFRAQELFDDPGEKRRWEKYFYYKASRVEYDKMVCKGIASPASWTRIRKRK